MSHNLWPISLFSTLIIIPLYYMNGYVKELFISIKDNKGMSVPYLFNGRRYKYNGVE